MVVKSKFDIGAEQFNQRDEITIGANPRESAVSLTSDICNMIYKISVGRMWAPACKMGRQGKGVCPRQTRD